MNSYILLQNTHRYDLPPEFREDDVRYSESLVEHFLGEYTRPGDVVFDPFAGYGTTLQVAEKMGRVPYGIEFDERRVQYARSKLRNPERLLHGDSRQLASYDLPACDLTITSPPFMGRHDTENPFTAYTTTGSYEAYLRDMRNIYAQIGRLIVPGGHVVIEVANLKSGDDLTTLAWDVAETVSEVLHFEGEVIVGWDRYGYGYDHSYCLVFTRPAGPRTMDLHLAVVTSCTDTCCRAQLVESGGAIDAVRSKPMVGHGIVVKPGQLVAVDRGADPPQVVYRWSSIEAERTGSGFTLIEDAKPVDLGRLRADYWPRIRQMYGHGTALGAPGSCATGFRKTFAGARLEIDDLFLLEAFQIAYLPGWVPERELGAVLAARPEIGRYLSTRCPQVAGFVEQVVREHGRRVSAVELADCEQEVVWTIADLLVYQKCPDVYDAQPFHAWDWSQVTSLVDLRGKTVVDCGAGTGRVALEAARTAGLVYAVEPVTRLRRFMRDKASASGLSNLYVVDGYLDRLPFPDRFADVVITSHALGWQLEDELSEFERVVQQPGIVIHCPGTADDGPENEIHCALVSDRWRYKVSRFEEADGWKRKYWKRID
jgi:SAM-dependent methyltransferase